MFMTGKKLKSMSYTREQNSLILGMVPETINHC